MSRKCDTLNRVLVKKNSDDTVTVTFLGATLLRKVAIPIPKDVATRVINSIMDDEERAKLCHKRGLFEEMANEAVKNGAGEQFQKDIIDFVEQGFTRVHRKTKKAEMQSPATPKKTKKAKRADAADEKPTPKKPKKEEKPSTEEAATTPTIEEEKVVKDKVEDETKTPDAETKTD